MSDDGPGSGSVDDLDFGAADGQDSGFGDSSDPASADGDGTATERLRAFYDDRAGLYDRVAGAPPVGRWRRRAVDALRLEAGDTVVEMGCGTGANLPYLHEAVGPDGAVVGVDFAPGALEQGRRRIARRGWRNVYLVHGDATRPPTPGPVDAVLATFVAGTLPDPAAAVETWCELLAEDGTVALLNARRADRLPASLCNPVFDWLVGTVNPGPRAGSADRLQRRVGAARSAVEDHTADRRDWTLAGGFLGLTVGRGRRR